MNETAPRAPRFLRYALFVLALVACLFLLFINRSLASLAEMIRPGSALWAHAALLIMEGVAILWLRHGIFSGSRHLSLTGEPSPEAQKAFAEELVRRMRANSHIRQAGIVPAGPGKEEEQEYLERCLAFLKDKADEEIKQTARRVFLATALAQNGRLDALIVFFSLCRLVWRVSSVYNQRPHPGEITSLYWAVASSTFLALSIEELDIATEITVGFGEAFHAMAPAGLTAGIPFAGKALQTFTASTIVGASNCYLALRAGIITRNAYAYGARFAEKPSRAAVFREAGSLLLVMSRELVGKVAGAVATGISKAARSTACNAGEKTVGGISRVGRNIGASAEKLVSGTADAAGKLAGGTVSTAERLTSATVSGAEKVASKTVTAVDKLSTGVMKAAGRIASGAVHAAVTTGSGIAKASRHTAGTVTRATGRATSGARSFLRITPKQPGKAGGPRASAPSSPAGKARKPTKK